MSAPEEEQTNLVKGASNVNDYLSHFVRRDLAMIITGLVVVAAVVAMFQVGAMQVLDKVLPLVLIAFGFFFGHRATRH